MPANRLPGDRAPAVPVTDDALRAFANDIADERIVGLPRGRYPETVLSKRSLALEVLALRAWVREAIDATKTDGNEERSWDVPALSAAMRISGAALLPPEAGG